MFRGAGGIYVYRSYGIHWMLNIVCGDRAGQAVLVRALEPRHGIEQMRARRPGAADELLCSGPGRLGVALGVGPELDGERIGEGRVLLVPPSEAADVVSGPRIGITRAVDEPWRFLRSGSRYASSPRPWARRRRPPA
jgi:DNA-3-methyladenine glycosylase